MAKAFSYSEGSVAKNPWVDKSGVGDEVPLTRRARAALRRALAIRGIDPGTSAYVFPAPTNPKRPRTRFRVRQLIERAEEIAGISHIGGTDAIRRKWVTERKDHPIPDLMRAGGWADPRSLQSYLHADPQTTFQVVGIRTRRIRRAETAG